MDTVLDGAPWHCSCILALLIRFFKCIPTGLWEVIEKQHFGSFFDLSLGLGVILEEVKYGNIYEGISKQIAYTR